MAMREAARQASPVITEPVMAVEISMPEEYLGTVIGDMAGRRGRIVSMADAPGGNKVVAATVPLATMFGYSTALRSSTAGRGSYVMEILGYEVVPANMTAGLIA